VTGGGDAGHGGRIVRVDVVVYVAVSVTEIVGHITRPPQRVAVDVAVGTHVVLGGKRVSTDYRHGLLDLQGGQSLVGLQTRAQ
jgi:hypothetical protein